MKRIFYNKIFVVILLLGISISLHARSENLLNNSDLTVLRPTSEVVKEMRNLKVVTNSDKIPVYWMPRSGNSQTVTYSAGEGKIILNIPGGKAAVIYHHTNILASSMEAGHYFRPTIEAFGNCTVGFSLYVYDKHGKYLTKLSKLSMRKITDGKNDFPIFTLPKIENAWLYTPIWEISGNKIIIDTFRLEEVDKFTIEYNEAVNKLSKISPLARPLMFDSEFTGLTEEQKKSLIRKRKDVSWLLAAAGDHNKNVARLALQQLVTNELKLPDGALPILIKLASDNDMFVRARACYLLGSMGPRALPAASILQSNLTVASEGVVSASAVALTQLGPIIYPTLSRLLLGNDRTIRLSIAVALRGMPGGIPSELKDAVDWASPRVVQSGSSLHPNSGFEADMDGWKVEFCDGAEGHWEITEKRASSGRKSLKLIKSNARGFIKLISTQPITIPPDPKRIPWTFRANFQSFTSSTDVFLIPRLLSDDNIYYGDDGGGMNPYYSWTSQYQIRNTPEAYWDKRMILFRPSAKDEIRVRPAMLLYGEPSEIWLDNVEFPAPVWKGIYAGRIYSQPEYTRKKMLQIVTKRPRVSVKLASENGKTTVKVNDKIVNHAIHMSWPTTGATADFKDMEKAGIAFPLISLSMQGALSLPPYGESWNGKDNVIFDDFFNSIEYALRQNPYGNYIIGLNLLWPPDYVDKNPDEAWLDMQGRRAYGTYGHMLGFANELPKRSGLFWWPSQYSEKYLKTFGSFFRNFLIELKKKPYAHIIAGIRIGGGHDFQFTIHSDVRDYSSHALIGFRRFLRSKYGSDSALVKAWGQPNITLDTVQIPDLTKSSVESKAFYAQDNIDYEIFRSRQEWIVPEYFARIFKEEMGKDKLALTWHMGASNDHSYFLESKYLDGTQSQPDYGMRLRGYSGGMIFEESSFNLHGKLSIKELDTRTWLRSDGNETFTMWVGTPLNEEQFHDQLFKEIGQTFVQNQGYCLFDFTGGYRHPAIFETFKTVTTTNNWLLNCNDKIDFTPQVALIYNSQSKNTGVVRHHTIWRLNESFHMALDLRTAGIPLQFYDMADLMRQPELLEKIRVVIFPNSVFFNRQEREFIKNVIKKNGRAVITCYASGFYDGKRYAVGNISNITDMKIVAEPINSNKRFSVQAVDSTDPLSKNLTQLQSHTVSFNEAAFQGAEWRYKGVQRFTIKDPEARILGRYLDDGNAAIGVKRFQDYISVYCASPGGLSPDLLRNLAVETGAFVVVDKVGLVTDINNCFMSIHCLKSDSYTIQLPQKSKVINAFTKETVAKGVNSITLDLTAQRTYWFLLENEE